jgi:hypothetical protein
MREFQFFESITYKKKIFHPSLKKIVFLQNSMVPMLLGAKMKFYVLVKLISMSKPHLSQLIKRSATHDALLSEID